MQNLRVGMLFLGCIKEVKDFELVISLPYNLTGFVQATNICEAYTKLLNEQVEKEEPVEVSVVILCRLSSLISLDCSENSFCFFVWNVVFFVRSV